jgi:hypothetical protein
MKDILEITRGIKVIAAGVQESSGAGSEIRLIMVGMQGPPGPPGQPGAVGGAAFNRNTDGSLSALKAVWEDANGIVRVLDYRDPDHIDLYAGVTTTATAQAGTVTVQRSGPLDASGLNLTPGRVWLGADGTLTRTPSSDGFRLLIGFATSNDRIILDPADALKL